MQLLSSKSSGLALVVLITKVHFAIGSGTDFVDGLALDALELVDSVVDFYFFAVFWVCYVDSTHGWSFLLEL